MNPVNENVKASVHQSRAFSLLSVAALLSLTIACSSDTASTVSASQAVTPKVQPAVVQSTETAGELVDASIKPARPQTSMLTYKSRDYGVSFQYPWQYARIGPRAIAQGDALLRPTPDGHEGQFTLVRIHVPKGFYPDTNYQNGYFALSLNPDLDEQQCYATLPVSPSAVQMQNINGTEFRWVETETGGAGASATLRNLVAFQGGTCYELELGVKTQNEQGLAREVNPEQVMRRLNAILQTVQIQSPVQTALLDEEVEVSSETSEE